ncbi:carbohydrate esterase family 5 protein [Sphaerobolus stellatus SS14]|uniref:cutinase n=1 Tax=Sphaerobolus stellatus (strain SS14) TaxID=990650 RepID=A0A0C9V392_SPHS4|nr:carbohydrate esterase family 5 protein [Sphaerobolus stellatus SS14]
MFKYATLLAFVLIAQVAATPTARAACFNVTVVFAHGTSETAPIGSVVGPPFQAALQTALGSKPLNFIGITYAADVAAFGAGEDAAGLATLAADVASQASACPNTKIVVSGYSVQSRVNAIIMFGDPDNGQALPGVLNSRELIICAAGDDI